MRMQRKKDTFCTSGVAGAILITTSANLLDTKYEFYKFNNDLRGSIN